MKDTIFCSKSDHADVANMEKESPIIVELLSKIKNRNADLETSDIHTRRRVKTRHRLFSKTGLDFLLIKMYFLLVMMVRKKSRKLQLNRQEEEQQNILFNLF